jgi:hypothetical protein
MCGDIESDESLGEEFYARFREHARQFLAKLTTQTRRGEASQLYAHLDALLRRELAAAADPDNAPDAVSGYERLRMEPLVHARIAGFMAAHQPLDEDPMKRLIEALMTGYAEGEGMLAERAREPHHHHTH